MTGKSIASSISVLVLGIILGVSPTLVTGVYAAPTVVTCTEMAPPGLVSVGPCGPAPGTTKCVVSHHNPMSVSVTGVVGGGKAACNATGMGVVAFCGPLALLPCMGVCGPHASPSCIVSAGARIPFVGTMGTCEADASGVPAPVTAVCTISWE